MPVTTMILVRGVDLSWYCFNSMEMSGCNLFRVHVPMCFVCLQEKCPVSSGNHLAL